MVINRTKSGEVVTDWPSFFKNHPDAEKQAKRVLISLVLEINKEVTA